MGKYRPSYAEIEERLRHTLGRLRAVRESLTEATEQRDALQAEVESLRLQVEMACIDPRPDCGCSELWDKLTEIADRGLAPKPTGLGPPDVDPWPPEPIQSAGEPAPIEIRVGQRWRHRSTHAPVVRVAAADGGIYKWTLEVEKTGDVCRVSDQWFANAILISEGES